MANVAPQAYLSSDLNNNPLLNVAPLTVNFDASGSVSIGGTISTYDFDWETDGTWDAVGNTTGLASHVFSPGNYTTTVRVTDNLSQHATATVSFLVINPANVAPVAAFTVDTPSGTAPLTVHLDASGATTPTGRSPSTSGTSTATASTTWTAV